MLKHVQHDGALRALLLLLSMLVAGPATAQTFPQLTGRVVDAAHLLKPDEAVALTAKLAAIEQATGHQVVVATIPDLQGYPLEDYGYRLGRAWGIGGKASNDGVVVFLAPNEPVGHRGPRIEVGYGLEPLMTDAFSSVVANSIMTPKLRAGDIAGALNAAADAIGEQIKLTPEEAAKRTAALSAQQHQQQQGRRSVHGGGFIFWIIILLFVGLPMLRRLGGGGRSYGGGSGLGSVILWSALNGLANSRDSGSSWGSSGGSDWGGGGGSDGGGFSGGGGSFGGGGASGGW